MFRQTPPKLKVLQDSHLPASVPPAVARFYHRHAARAETRIQFQKTKCRLPTPPPAAIPLEGTQSLLELLPDELILLIFQELAAFNNIGCDENATRVHPPALRRAVLASRRRTGALLLCSRRFHSVFLTLGEALHREMKARQTTHVMPRNVLTSALPFTEQEALEDISAKQLRLLLATRNRSGAMHCTRNCNDFQCALRRRKLNRIAYEKAGKATARCEIVNVADGSISTTSTPCGTVVFSHLRRRTPPPPRHERSPAPERDMLVCSNLTEYVDSQGRPRVRFAEHASVVLNSDAQGAPASMAASHDGRWLAYCATSRAHTVPLYSCSHLCLWDTQSTSATVPTEILPPPHAAEHFLTINAQACWWTSDHELAVCWSTQYLEPDLPHNAHGWVSPVTATSCYQFATYSHSPDNDAWVLNGTLGPFDGLPSAVSATRSGEEVVAVVQRRHGPKTPAAYVVFHNIQTGKFSQVDPSAAWRLNAHGFADHSQGPIAATLSPNGDCALCLHKTRAGLVLEILTRAGRDVFVTTGLHDVSQHIAIADTDSYTGLPALRAAFAIAFSPCGRYATILDQHPYWGRMQNKCSLLVVDLALRYSSQLVCTPMASSIQTPLRSLFWNRAGILTQPKFGALFHWSP